MIEFAKIETLPFTERFTRMKIKTIPNHFQKTRIDFRMPFFIRSQKKKKLVTPRVGVQAVSNLNQIFPTTKTPT